MALIVSLQNELVIVDDNEGSRLVAGYEFFQRLSFDLKVVDGFLDGAATGSCENERTAVLSISTGLKAKRSMSLISASCQYNHLPNRVDELNSARNAEPSATKTISTAFFLVNLLAEIFSANAELQWSNLGNWV